MPNTGNLSGNASIRSSTTAGYVDFSGKIALDFGSLKGTTELTFEITFSPTAVIKE